MAGYGVPPSPARFVRLAKPTGCMSLRTTIASAFATTARIGALFDSAPGATGRDRRVGQGIGVRSMCESLLKPAWMPASATSAGGIRKFQARPCACRCQPTPSSCDRSPRDQTCDQTGPCRVFGILDSRTALIRPCQVCCRRCSIRSNAPSIVANVGFKGAPSDIPKAASTYQFPASPS